MLGKHATVVINIEVTYILYMQLVQSLLHQTASRKQLEKFKIGRMALKSLTVSLRVRQCVSEQDSLCWVQH